MRISSYYNLSTGETLYRVEKDDLAPYPESTEVYAAEVSIGLTKAQAREVMDALQEEFGGVRGAKGWALLVQRHTPMDADTGAPQGEASGQAQGQEELF